MSRQQQYPAEPRTVAELLRKRALEPAGKDAILSYATKGTTFENFSARQLETFAYHAARGLAKFVPPRTSSAEKADVIGVLGRSNFDYVINFLALSKLGHTVLFLSTRLSVHACVHLLRTTGAKRLLIQELFGETSRQIKEQLPCLPISEMVSRQVYDVGPVQLPQAHLLTQLDPGVETESRAWIIHSSGSTGLPKPIYQTNRAAVTNYSLNPGLKAFTTLPLFHNHGLSNFFRAIHSRKQIHLWNADLPLASQSLLETMRGNDFEIFYAVPFALKQLVNSKEGVEVLRKMKVVMCGGSACPDPLGDLLVSEGVNLVSHYGLTEVGQLMTSFRPAGDDAWNYLRVPDSLQPYLRWIPRGNDTFEACVLDGWPAKVVSNLPDGSFSTKDLFIKHATIPNAWKYVARLDDTLVLLNGEKTGVAHIESCVKSHVLVLEAVCFGNERPMLGIMLVPSESGAQLSAAELRDAIWPLVQLLNASLDAFARIDKRMIWTLPAGTLYPQTDKGTCIRTAFYEHFAEQIEAAYKDPELVEGKRLALDEGDLRVFLRNQLQEILSADRRVGDRLSDQSDFFGLGLDSLQAIQLRNKILENVDLDAKLLGENAVFDFPSIEALVRHICTGSSGTDQAKHPVEDDMQSLIKVYGTFSAIPEYKVKPHTDSSRRVLLTGATGSLGAHILYQLLQDPSVSSIYCLVRKATDEVEAMERVKLSLKSRRLDITSPDDLSKLHCIPKGSGESQLKPGSPTWTILQASIDSIIHCAWCVNFQLALRSFERDGIAGLRNLLLLALASGASFDFCSSVSVVAKCLGEVEETRCALLTSAQATGYAQSKLVAENIIWNCARRTGLQARILRVGQITGDTKYGIWNGNEAIPLLLQSAKTTGALPILDEELRWMPVDRVAAVFCEVSRSKCPGGSILNIVNPQPFHWTQDLLPALHEAGLDFRSVGPREWIRGLRAAEQDPVKNPPIKLLHFFAAKYEQAAGVRLGKEYATQQARKWSPTMASVTAAEVIGREAVERFLDHFKRRCW